MTAPLVFVRHAESALNVDERVSDFAHVPLTPKGRVQAQTLASTHGMTGAMVIASPYLAPWETAIALAHAGGTSPVADPLLREFCYLDPDFANGTVRSERQMRASRYWDACDVDYRDGGAESFREFAARVGEYLERMADVPPPDGTMHLTHGMWLITARALVAEPGASLEAALLRVRADLRGRGVPANCELVRIAPVRGVRNG